MTHYPFTLKKFIHQKGKNENKGKRKKREGDIFHYALHGHIHNDTRVLIT